MICLTLMLSAFFVFESDGALNALNDSISILIIFSIPIMGSKVFIHHFQSDYNEIYNRDDYLIFDYDSIDFKALVFFLKGAFSFTVIQ